MSSAVSSTNTSQTCDGIQENNLCSSGEGFERALQCCEEIVEQQVPNFLRLFVNPFVAGCCIGLSELSCMGFPSLRSSSILPSFLANSGDDALSGAFKLARFWRSRSKPVMAALPDDLLVDDAMEYNGFCNVWCSDPSSGHERLVNFIPGIRNAILSDGCRILHEDLKHQTKMPRIVAITANSLRQLSPEALCDLQELREGGRLILIVVLNIAFFENQQPPLGRLRPDIVVFDQSFTNGQIPFGAMTSRDDLLRIWHSRKLSMFHSTTFQPNSVSTRWFLNCLRDRFPEVHRKIEPTLARLTVDRHFCVRIIRQLYSPSLSRTIMRTGFHNQTCTTAGHYVRSGSRRIFDGVAGVACSLRGHNPVEWAAEVRQAPRGSLLRDLLQAKLCELTGLSRFVPAVSGGSAVEQALKLALSVSNTGSEVIVMRRGYSGKTLFALTGTASDFYRRGVEPLYDNTSVIDPLAPDAEQQFESIVSRGQTAAVLLELIQGVGGVREIPLVLLNRIFQLRKQYGFRIIVDEVQTGVFRTGPFVRSAVLPERPDFLTIGKAVSDMMIPFSLTLYTDQVHRDLVASRCSLPEHFWNKFDFELAFRTLWNTLYCQNPDRIRERVEQSGRLLETELRERLARWLAPESIRVFGLLCGIELPLPTAKTKQRFSSLIVMLRCLHMMKNSGFPLLMGFCQFEPNVLKFTPPLSITDSELKLCCETITSGVAASTTELLMLGLKSLLNR